MTKDEQFALAKRTLLEKVNSWADIYDLFDATMEQVCATMQPHVVFNAVFLMYAFLNAMRELPEEGDIKVIAERMVYILIYEGKEKLGSDVSLSTESEAKQFTAARVREIAAAVAAEALAEYDTGTAKTLH